MEPLVGPQPHRGELLAVSLDRPVHQNVVPLLSSASLKISPSPHSLLLPSITLCSSRPISSFPQESHLLSSTFQRRNSGIARLVEENNVSGGVATPRLPGSEKSPRSVFAVTGLAVVRT